jgi:GDPmannose 4,6-dehydratase
MPVNPSDSEPRRALITGVTGQDGSYLAELLLAKGYSVWGMVRRHSSGSTDRIEHLQKPLEGQSRLELVNGDLRDGGSLLRLLREIRPHEVYNLAAQSDVKVSFSVPEYTADVTGLGALRLLEAIREIDLPARFFQASSSEMFGKVKETPQDETTPFHPRSPYGSAKAFAFYTTCNYREAYGLFAVNGIMFNHESPRRGESFVTRKISLAASRIKAGSQDVLQLGNLEAKRDWGYAADYVEAAWRMLQQSTAGDYVLATGESHSVREFCEICFRHVGLPLTWRGEGIDEVGLDAEGRTVVAIDADYYRPAEVDTLRGNAAKARTELGWAPTVSFADLATMMVEHDLELARREVAGMAPPAP